MSSKALELERARLEAALQSENTPQNRHALALVKARESALVVQIHTPQRGTPFAVDQVATDGAKQTRERVHVGFVTATKVTIPAHDGLLTVLPGHAPMVALLGDGEVVVTTSRATVPNDRMMGRDVEIADGDSVRFFVSGGAFSVRDNRVIVLPERGFSPSRLSLDDIEDEARRRAIQARIAEEGLEGDALAQALGEAKREEVGAMRSELEGGTPSLKKEASMRRLRAMQRTLESL